MAALVIVDISIHDTEGYEEYKRLASPTIAAFDGKYVVRGGQTEILEGHWQPGRIVVLEFPTVERAKEWWNSDIYSAAKAVRHRTANTKMMVVEGI